MSSHDREEKKKEKKRGTFGAILLHLVFHFFFFFCNKPYIYALCAWSCLAYKQTLIFTPLLPSPIAQTNSRMRYYPTTLLFSSSFFPSITSYKSLVFDGQAWFHKLIFNNNNNQPLTRAMHGNLIDYQTIQMHKLPLLT